MFYVLVVKKYIRLSGYTTVMYKHGSTLALCVPFLLCGISPVKGKRLLKEKKLSPPSSDHLSTEISSFQCCKDSFFFFLRLGVASNKMAGLMQCTKVRLQEQNI